MPNDRRARALDYLEATLLPAVAATLPSPCFVYRNRTDIDPFNPETKDPQLPALVLLDNSEALVTDTQGKGSGGLVDALYEMNPQIYVALMPDQTGMNATKGTELSLFRNKVLKGFNTDEGLMAILGGHGEIRYLGLQSDMHAEGPMVGQEAMNFAFRYAIDFAGL